MRLDLTVASERVPQPRPIAVGGLTGIGDEGPAMRPAFRVLLVCSLAVVQLGLGVHYGATADEQWPHPTGDQLADDIDGWDGETVLLIGEVVDADPAGEEASLVPGEVFYLAADTVKLWTGLWGMEAFYRWVSGYETAVTTDYDVHSESGPR